MSISSSQEQILREWAALRAQWRTTSSLWNDAVKVQFENQYWQPLENTMPQYLESLKQLASVIEQAKRIVR